MNGWVDSVELRIQSSLDTVTVSTRGQRWPRLGDGGEDVLVTVSRTTLTTNDSQEHTHPLSGHDIRLYRERESSK